MRKQRRTKIELENELKIAKSLFETREMSIRQISQELNLNTKIISRYFLNNGLDTNKFVGHKTYTLDEGYFSKECNEERAYILGFVMADGHVGKHGRSCCINITLTEDDIELLHKINSAIGSNRPLSYIKPSENRYSKKGQFKLSIINKNMFESLISIGINSLGSIPSYISNIHLNAFIRGLFDGDGCISIENRKDKKETHLFVAGHFNIMFNEKDLAEQVQNILVEKLGLSKTKIVERTGNGIQPVFIVRWSGTRSLEILRDYLYKDSTIFLDRKKEKFSQIRSSNCRPK